MWKSLVGANDGDWRFGYSFLKTPHKILINYKEKLVNLRCKNLRLQFYQVIKVNILSEGTNQHLTPPFVIHGKEHSIISVVFLPRMHGQSLIMRKH